MCSGPAPTLPSSSSFVGRRAKRRRTGSSCASRRGSSGLRGLASTASTAAASSFPWRRESAYSPRGCGFASAPQPMTRKGHGARVGGLNGARGEPRPVRAHPVELAAHRRRVAGVVEDHGNELAVRGPCGEDGDLVVHGPALGPPVLREPGPSGTVLERDRRELRERGVDGLDALLDELVRVLADDVLLLGGHHEDVGDAPVEGRREVRMGARDREPHVIDAGAPADGAHDPLADRRPGSRSNRRTRAPSERRSRRRERERAHGSDPQCPPRRRPGRRSPRAG